MATTTEKKAAAAKKTFTSPKGTFLFPRIVEVDYGTEKFPCEEGRFSLTLLLDQEAADRLRTMLAEEIENARVAAEEAFDGLSPAKRNKFPTGITFNDVGEDDYDKEGEPTGLVRFRFKTNAYFTRRNGKRELNRVAVFDSMARPVTLDSDPGNGTEGRVSFTPGAYFVESYAVGGLALYLNAVMITKLVKFGQRDAAEYGFEADEEGEFSSPVLGGPCSTEGDKGDAPNPDDISF